MTRIRSRSSDLAPGTTFPPIADGFALGGDYSPEQWPEEVWVEDVELMRRAGVNSVNLGVFSWGLIEVADGEFEWGWLDRVMDLLHAGGIGVNLATPTAAPPIWLLRAHPEITCVTDTGVRLAQGGRLAWSPSSRVFRRYALRLVERMAERYGTHPALRMWHVSNELGNENAHDHGDETAAAFQEWLRARFATIEDLVAAWGTAFWGHRYTSFDQVLPPRFSGTSHNPGLQLAFEQYTSDALLGHHLAEREVLRRITPGIPVTTNFMVQNHPGVADYRRWAEEVDLVSNDHYTIAADPERQGELAFSADRVRGMAHGDPWLLIEHSASAVNWQPRNRVKSPGELARNSLAHIARGAEGALFFQWRQSTGGSEQFHSAVVPHAGADSRVYREVAELGALLGRIREVAGSRVETARVAILMDHASWTALRCGPKPSVDVTALDAPLTLHRELTARGIAVDVLHPDDDLSGYAVVLAPTLLVLTPEAARALSVFVEGGGHLAVTYLSAVVDRHNRVVPGGYPALLRDLLGVRVEEHAPLLEDEEVLLDPPGRVRIWTERLRADDAEVVATYASGDLAGLPAVTRAVRGRGTATYVSTHLDRERAGRLVDDLVARGGVAPVASAEPGLELVRRVGAEASWLFAINHTDRDLRLDVDGLDLVTGRRRASGSVIAAGSVAVIREDAR